MAPHLKYNFRYNLKPHCISLGVALACWNDKLSDKFVCRQTNPGSNTELTFYCSIWFLVYKMQTKKPKSSLPKLVTIGDNTYKEPRTSNKTTKLEPNHLRKARIYLFPILDSKEIKPINPKGNQPCIFTRRTDAENEAPVLWPPHAKSWLIEKGLDAGKDWRQKEKGATEDEMVG